MEAQSKNLRHSFEFTMPRARTSTLGICRRHLALDPHDHQEAAGPRCNDGRWHHVSLPMITSGPDEVVGVRCIYRDCQPSSAAQSSPRVCCHHPMFSRSKAVVVLFLFFRLVSSLSPTYLDCQRQKPAGTSQLTGCPPGTVFVSQDTSNQDTSFTSVQDAVLDL